MKEGWTYKKFKEVCTSITDGDWIEKKDQSQSGIRLVQTGNIGIGEFIPKDDSHKYISEDTFNRLKCTEIFEGDILISRLPNPLGRSCILPKLETRCITAVDCSILRIKKDTILPKFFVYYTQSQGYFSKIDSESSGTTRARITRKKLEETTIPIPPVSKQKRIVKRLDAAFAHIDELKANAEKQLTEAPALFQNCLTKAMEPKEGWEEKKLEDICTNIIDCPHSTPRKVDYPTQYPCIRTSELKGGKIEWKSMQYLDEEEYNIRTSRIKPQPNDIVYGREGTYGDAVLLPEGYFFSLGQRTMLFRPDVDRVIPQFLLYSVISSHVYEQAKAKNSGCGVGHVNVKDIKLFNIGVPKSLSEQQRIVARLDSLSENIRKYEEIQRKVISECDALKQALLRKVFE